MEGFIAIAGIFVMVVLYVIAAVICMAIYMLPAIIAFIRKHERRWLILALDLVLGGTGIGWIAALVWACLSTKQESAIIGGVKDSAQSLKEMGDK